MKFHRIAQAALVEQPTRATASLALKSDEVSRFAARLVVVDRRREDSYVTPFARLPALLHAGDLVVVNDAATLPASLRGITARGEAVNHPDLFFGFQTGQFPSESLGSAFRVQRTNCGDGHGFESGVRAVKDIQNALLALIALEPEQCSEGAAANADRLRSREEFFV